MKIIHPMISLSIPLAMAVVLLCGCQTLVYQGGRRAQYEQELEDMNATLERLEERVTALAHSQEALRNELDGIREQSSADREAVKQSLTQMEGRMSASDEGYKKMRQELIDEVPKKISQLISSQTPASSGYEQGREHVVQTGETLSEIAKAYGVRPADIIKANKLKDPNAIRVGQKLFIPE